MEILSHTLAASIVVQRVAASWPWYVIRAAGFTAAILLFLLMLSGIGQVTGATYRFLPPVKAWVVHRALGIALALSVAVHVGFLLVDNYLPFTWQQVLIPFASKYNNKTSWLGLPLGALGVTFGILAMYILVIVLLSSLGWINTKPKRWRWLHYLSYVLLFFVFLHGLYVGTDLRYGLFRDTWIFFGVVIILAIISRLFRAGTHKPTE